MAGAAGTGKSQLALAVVELLGADIAARVPMDYFITPRTVPMDDWLQQPLAYDHAAIRVLLQAGSHTTRLSPPFDFATFTRSAVSGKRKEVPIRPVMVLDAMEPWPDADLTVLVTTPDDVRYQRIIDRDARWGSRVGERWEHLELCRRHVESLDHRYDLTLNGETSIDDNAEHILDEMRRRRLIPTVRQPPL